jgi:hypothetical protein
MHKSFDSVRLKVPAEKAYQGRRVWCEWRERVLTHVTLRDRAALCRWHVMACCTLASSSASNVTLNWADLWLESDRVNWSSHGWLTEVIIRVSLNSKWTQVSRKWPSAGVWSSTRAMITKPVSTDRACTQNLSEEQKPAKALIGLSDGCHSLHFSWSLHYLQLHRINSLRARLT